MREVRSFLTHLPCLSAVLPATRSDAFAQRETGDRNGCCGHDSFQVTGDGHSGQPFGCQPFSLQPPETRSQLPMAERPIPELPMTAPVTCLYASPYTRYSILNTRLYSVPPSL